ncbi:MULTISPECIES: MobF family relaxase [unclassified Cryobacterium]|uniref:MobF family relaxase n=1 Tax=unclassified Cryobacterium TaxID=2649013 RepID=UPI00106DA12C|nr:MULTISPECIES: MobF family relaxase [unclassified Cryobacterium]TFB92258.1 conjugal transfer protein, Dtr system [Cryobacterium sp. MDB2-A-1]TFC08113.1 conjugal transfer protein, Dtr system [Cryobacterium sp. MDB2-A-2]
MMTMHILSAGDGYAYYISETATADVKREAGLQLGDYYTIEGNPPGVWVGSGLAALGVSGAVTEEQMKALYGEGLHPDAEQIIATAQGEGKSADEAIELAKLGRGYYSYKQGTTDLREQIETGYGGFTRINHREPNAEERRVIRVREGAQAFRTAKGRQPADKEELGRFITAATRPTQQAVAGFDLVFSPAKSVSTLWGLGDNETRKAIEEEHEAAISDTIGYLEREAIATRAGTNGVAQIDVEGGLIATRFRHYDSRNGDPQLHDHLVVANKVKGVDGKWRTIDSKLLHRQGVAASEFYNQRVMDRVTDRLNLATELREVTPSKRPVVEIAGIDARLMAGFSSRSAGIKAAMVTLEAEYRATHGRTPDTKARIALAQQATLDTRPQKLHARALSDLRTLWRGQAATLVGARAVEGILEDARAHSRGDGTPKAPAQNITLAQAAAQVVETVSEHHAVWGPHTIEAETRRYVQAQRSSGNTVEGTVEQITRHALNTDSITVTPPAPHGAFQPLTRRDGTSIYEHKGRQLLTSRSILAAEDTLLDAARTRTASPMSRDVFDQVAAKEGRHLDAGQRELARVFATSSTRLVVGSGPAGTGKTTALRVAARAVEAQGGKVVGLAPSATAAAMMKDAIGIDAKTIHSFTFQKGSLAELLQQTERIEGVDLNPGDVIVVDEAGMAGTTNLAKVTRIAQLHGAHVRLIGDDRQLSAVEAGGALRLLENEVGSVKLDQLHRFTSTDEAEATKLLRDPATTGDPFAWYVKNDRVAGGSVDRMSGQVFSAWQSDTAAGLHSVMLAQQNSTVAELNARAQAFRMSEGIVTGKQSAPLRDGLAAYRGDTVVTRVNNSQLKVSGGRDIVKNGDLWTVVKAHRDGTLAVSNQGTGGTITLPKEYVTGAVELGYASTIHRAQGMTADTAHVLADSSTSRELVYVGLTRGKHENHLYVETADAQPVSDVLAQITGNADGMLSATETIRAEQARVDDLATLIDQYGDVHERADVLRFAAIANQGLGEGLATMLRGHESWGAVEAALRHSEAAGLDPVDTIRQAWTQRDMNNAQDPAAVLASRISDNTDRHRATVPADQEQEKERAAPAVPAWIASRRGIDSEHAAPEWREHLAERYDYLHTRLEERGATIAAEQPAWASELGEVPADVDRRQQWTELAAEVDVFRTQYRINPQETVAVPADYRQRPVGADLAERVTAMHKSQVLSSRPAATEDDRQRAAAAAATAAALRARQAAAARPGTTTVKPLQKVTEAKSTAQRMKEQQQKRAADRVEQLRRQGVNVKVQKTGDRDRQSGADQAPARDQGIER